MSEAATEPMLGAWLLALGAFAVGLEVENERLLDPQTYGGVESSTRSVRLATSHGKPGDVHNDIMRWAERVGWEPGLYVDADRDTPFFTGLSVMLIEPADTKAN